jgi:pimeloyl-ACP methyl ester carboxylesterase
VAVPSSAGSFVTLHALGRDLRLETRWVGPVATAHPPVVFLHEGLGSVALWRDFPQRFCERHGLRGLVYSRFGYGRSTPRPHDERFPVTFMHREAREVLPALLDALDIERAWLFGHSDGGSIALLAASALPARTAGVVALAPHVFVEDVSVTSIAATRDTYRHGSLRERLARFHGDVDSAFWGWNDVWLDPAFRSWNIENELDGIACPVMAVQGEDDEYGTLEQVHRIQRRLPKTRLLILPDCGHSPHRDQPQPLIDAAGAFIVGGGR